MAQPDLRPVRDPPDRPPPTAESSHGGGSGTPPGERLARVEARLDSLHTLISEHMATKNDISKVKIWFLGGVLAAIGLAIPAAVGVAFVVARLAGG